MASRHAYYLQMLTGAAPVRVAARSEDDLLAEARAGIVLADELAVEARQEIGSERVGLQPLQHASRLPGSDRLRTSLSPGCESSGHPVAGLSTSCG